MCLLILVHFMMLLTLADKNVLLLYNQIIQAHWIWNMWVDFRLWCNENTLTFRSIAACNSPAPLRWRHNGHDSVSNHQPHHCLLNRLFRRRSKKISKLHVTGICVGNSPETGEFPAQMASNAENVSIWWRHHDMRKLLLLIHNQTLVRHLQYSQY